MVEDPIIINLILKNADKEKFLKLKRFKGVEKPNTQIITECLRESYERLKR